MIKRRNRPSPRKVIPVEKPIEKFKPKLIILPGEKKIDIIQEEVVSVPEEIPVVDEVINKVVSAPEELLEEEQLLEETVGPSEEILEKEEKIVKDTIEVPKVGIFSCQFCGMELSSDRIFCLRCGHKLKK